MLIDDPDVLADVRAEFERYERALVANDREVLVDFFLDSPTTVRYGIDDAQYGHEELAAFRRSQAVATPPRDLQRTVITTFGSDLAVTNTEFVPHGSDAVGRFALSTTTRCSPCRRFRSSRRSSPASPST